MSDMTDATTQPSATPADIRLLLRAHAEQRWLIAKVIPLLRQLEQAHTPAVEDLDAALAYLEVLWLEAGLRASVTDAAARELKDACQGACPQLADRAARYHATVHRLRSAVDLRVRALTAPRALPAAEEPASS
jgi:hypothetical protein